MTRKLRALWALHVIGALNEDILLALLKHDEAHVRGWAIRLALEAPLKGADVFIIANADTVMTRANNELLSQVFPKVPVKGQFSSNQPLLSIDKARRLLGYEPQHSWRNK